MRLRLGLFFRQRASGMCLTTNKFVRPGEGGIMRLPTRKQGRAYIVVFDSYRRDVDGTFLASFMKGSVSQLRTSRFRRSLANSPVGDPYQDNVVTNLNRIRLCNFTINALRNSLLRANGNHRQVVVVLSRVIVRYPFKDLCFGQFMRNGASKTI